MDSTILPAFLKSHKKGKKVIYSEFISAGNSKKAAFFDKKNKNVLIFIENLTDAGIISDFADGIRFRGYKREELIFRDKEFLVKDYYFDGAKHHIYLTEI